MDYKDIEQMLERYWAAETTLAEERTLRAYFSNAAQVPAHLQVYCKLFAGMQAANAPTLGADFDAKVTARIQHPTVKARRLTLSMYLAPLWKSAAAIALLVTVGTTMQRTMQPEQTDGRAMAQEPDTTIAVQVAYEPNAPIDSIKIVDETLLK